MAAASISRVMNRNGHSPSPKRIGTMNFSPNHTWSMPGVDTVRRASRAARRSARSSCLSITPSKNSKTPYKDVIAPQTFFMILLIPGAVVRRAGHGTVVCHFIT